MLKLSKRELEIVEMLTQGMEPKSHGGGIVHNNRVTVSAFGAYPKKKPARAITVNSCT
jgi:hypothetical protein